MHQLPMSTFVDFIMANGVPRVTLVTRWKREEAESHDFYAGLKSAIVGMHSKGLGVDSLRTFFASQSDARRKRIYPELAAHYGKIMRKMPALLTQNGAPPVFGRSRPVLATFGIAPRNPGVRVDPLLSLTVGGKVYLVKLYLRSDKPTAKRVAITLGLMHAAYAETSQPLLSKGGDLHMALLDVRREQLHMTSATPTPIWTLLHGELAAFTAIYWRV